MTRLTPCSRTHAMALPAVLLAWLCPAPSHGQLGSHRATFFTEDNLIPFYQPASNDEFAFAVAAGDFNCDGADDLATGIPFDDNLVGFYPNSGIVIIRYGVLGQGLDTGVTNAILTQFTGSSPDPYQAEPGDEFGRALAAGDFNGDGCDDLAVGVPGESPVEANDPGAGAVQIHYGSPSGLDLGGAQFLHEDSPGVPGGVSKNDSFGWALAAADFNGDGRDDLAIGVPFEGSVSLFGSHHYGSVNILYGTSAGLSPSAAQRFHQDTPGIPGSNENFDNFGRALAACDFNGDGAADLAIGVPHENTSKGSVRVLYGGVSGLGVAGAQSWDQNTDLVLEVAENGDLFGWSLACGDFDADSYDDLAISVPLEDVGTVVDAGAVRVLRGSPSGLTAFQNQLWTQNSGVQEVSEANDQFGTALAAGDFDRDGRADLAIGVPGKNNGNGPFEGAVHVLYGRAVLGLGALGSQLWRQAVNGVSGTAEQGDEFGRSLAVGDFDGSGHADLVIGAPRESTAATSGNGAEWVLYGYLFANGFESGTTSAWSLTGQ